MLKNFKRAMSIFCYLLGTLFLLPSGLLGAEALTKDQQVLAKNLGNLSIFYFNDAKVLHRYISAENKENLMALLDKGLELTNTNLKSFEEDETPSRYYLVINNIDSFSLKKDKRLKRIYDKGEFKNVPLIDKSEELLNKVYLEQIIFRYKNNLALEPIASSTELLDKAKQQFKDLVNSNEKSK